MRALVLTLLSAALYGAAFPPLGASPVAWVALAPFLIAVAAERPVRAAFLGLVFVMAVGAALTWWAPHMLVAYFGLSAGVAWIYAAGIALGTAGPYWIAFAVWVAWAGRRLPLHPFAVAAAWTAAELARARLLLGNPWGMLAYATPAGGLLGQTADATGPYGATFVLAAVSAVAAGAFASRLRPRHPFAALIMVAALVSVALAYGWWRMREPVDEGPGLKVAIVQGAVTRAFREQARDPAASVARHLALTREAAVQKPALAVWPEYAVDIYIQEPSAARDELFTASRDLGIDFVLGGPFSAFGSTKLRYRNAVFAVRAGKLAGRYDKLHLVPFAERIPAWWPLRAHRQEYEPGPRPFVLATRDARVGAFVCAESLDPAIPRALATAGADLLANLSNDYWFSDDAAALEQLNAAAWRAVENRRWLLRATPTGYSAVIDPHGRVREMTSRGNAEFLVADVWPRAPVTPYQRAGDLAAWLAVAGVGLASLRRLLY